MPLPRGLLKSLIREGYSAPEAMKEAWRRVRKNPGARWHGREATEAEGDRVSAERRGMVLASHYYRGKREAHRESQEASRMVGMNPSSAYDVFLRGKKIDTVFQSDPSSADEVKRSLIEHDGYDPEIRVVKQRKRKPRTRRNPSDEWQDKYRQFASDHHLALNEKSLRFFGVRSLTHLRQLAEHDPTLNNIPLRRFDALTASYNAYNPRNRMTLSEGANVYKYLLLRMVGLANPRLSRKRYRHERLEPKGRFDPRSFRTVRSGKALVTVGCPKGEYDPRRRRCKVGTRAQRIMRPKGNPRGSRDILLIKPTGDPYGRGWEAIQSTDGGQTWFYRGDLGRRSRGWWRDYARRMGYTLRVENPLNRTETRAVYSAAARFYQRAADRPRGSAPRAYRVGRADSYRKVVQEYGARRHRMRVPARVSVNPPRIIGPIPGVMRRIEYRRTKDRPGMYYHNFNRGVRAYALADGSVLLRGPKPLYVNQ